MNINKLFFLIFFIFLLYSGNVYSQDTWWKEKKYTTEAVREKYRLCKYTFLQIAEGFNRGQVGYFNSYFDSQVYLNVISYEKGFYSSGQAELILKDFMEYFKVVNFKYLRSKRNSNYAFAVGTYKYNLGSGRRKLNASVSLRYVDNRWIIDHVSIN